MSKWPRLPHHIPCCTSASPSAHISGCVLVFLLLNNSIPTNLATSDNTYYFTVFVGQHLGHNLTGSFSLSFHKAVIKALILSEHCNQDCDIVWAPAGDRFTSSPMWLLLESTSLQTATMRGLSSCWLLAGGPLQLLVTHPFPCSSS